MAYRIKNEKKHILVLTFLLFILGIFIIKTFQTPLLAASAICSDGECSCSCTGISCFCNTADNACQCFCVPSNYEYCNKSGKMPDLPG